MYCFAINNEKLVIRLRM
ncbi:hypothetical protein MMI98_05855, partial [Enterococcus cecorum]|nr:hypothetical protein [Enterococcus cecorum]